MGMGIPRPPGSASPWSADDDARLRELFNADEVTIDVIAHRLRRSPASVRARLGKLRAAGLVITKRQGTRRKVPADQQPTDTADVVQAIDMLVDTRIRRWRVGQAFHQTADPLGDLDRADERIDNALKLLTDTLERWKR